MTFQRRSISTLLLSVILACGACRCASIDSPNDGAKSTPKEEAVANPDNRLRFEKSPYLLQHKDNPINWYAWGPEAFAAAEERDVPIFLSIGYSTCHWCHVMERESFEDESVAEVLNRDFVAIKVDREERPDVDALYMEAVQAMTGSGGWPMSVFLTPDRKPFFGGTYFQKPRFLDLLARITVLWNDERDRIFATGRRLTETITKPHAALAGRLDESLFDRYLGQWSDRFDPVHGGAKGAPKFPPAYDLMMLLRIYHRTGSADALHIVTKTLDEMARGGVYDHLGGGFHRYSVDARWMEPHFEKMLYDQASLSMAYLEAFRVTAKREYELVVREILDYVLREMTHENGAFFSAEDADSEGVEGKYYLWNYEEVKDLLSAAELAEVQETFGLTEWGRFENSNLLHLQGDHSRSERSASLTAAMQRMYDVRFRRVHPHLDDKILTDWNGLMISAMAQAARVLDESRYLEGAQRAAKFLLETMQKEDGTLLHRWRDGQARFPAYLDDYAYLIDGLIEIYQSDFDPAWLHAARRLQAQQDRLFLKDDGSDYFTTDGSDETMLARRIEAFDNVRPAGRSVTARNLLRLADLLLEPSRAEAAERVMKSSPAVLDRAPMAFPYLLIALDYALAPSKEIAVIGSPEHRSTRAMLEALRRGFRPHQVIAVGLGGDDAEPPLLERKVMRDGAVTAYVCENGICRLPTTDPEQARKLASTYTAH